MKIRRNLAILGIISILFGCGTLYWMTDSTFRAKRDFPSSEYQDNKWLHFDTRLKHLENVIAEKQVVQRWSENDTKRSRVMVVDIPEPDTCSLSTRVPPNTEIQTLELYKKLPFDNPDGGAWKQGWSIRYDEKQWSFNRKLKVFIVPHSHNDPGWIKTFEQYYEQKTKNIFNNMLEKLTDNRKFIWAEISFLSLWWENASQNSKETLKRLVENGNLEIVTGGWVMNDEANTHWQNMLLQLTEGHQWLQKNINIKPKNAWTIDPFGESPTMAYLLKKSNLENLVIQRVHYSIKKELAANRQLEFLWRQIWDGNGDTDLFTHMMPFYSYDVPHTCGPDPAVCCQFDFARIAVYGYSCPWHKQPTFITDSNVAQRALKLLDQYRQKAQLYKTNVLLIPLGDDFRYDRNSEWDAQYNNYQKLIDYYNSNKALNTEVQFGTLEDYFHAVHEEKPLTSFPSLSGDFFTYADRDQHYWSGYYTSRPFYKRMDRVLMGYVRAAEILTVLAANSEKIGSAWVLGFTSTISDLLSEARQNLALFQHHDGVTGTAKDHVVIDYGVKMVKAITNSQKVIQLCANVLLSSSPQVSSADTIYYDVDEYRSKYNKLPTRKIIKFNNYDLVKRVVFYNSLAFVRKEVVFLLVSSPFVQVRDANQTLIDCQINPIFKLKDDELSYKQDPQFEVAFIAEIPALGLSTYFIEPASKKNITSKTHLSRVSLYNYDGKLPVIRGFYDIKTHPATEFSIKNNKLSVAFKDNGLLKAIRIDSRTYPVHLDFIKYGVSAHKGEKSGAYLFLPDGPGIPLEEMQSLVTVKVIEGPIYSFVNVEFSVVEHSVYLYNSFGADNLGIEIQNTVNLASTADYELAMRLSTKISSQDDFFSDLNGYQLLRRKRFSKLPIQAHYYPYASAAYIEDPNLRLTVLTAGALGVSSQKEGQIEIMQDRRLTHDDNRGLNQGVLDNLPTKHVFRILLEHRKPDCDGIVENHPSGFLSLNAHLASETLLNPIYTLIATKDSPKASYMRHTPVEKDLEVDVSVASLRASVYANSNSDNFGLVLHRKHIDECYPMLPEYPLSPGYVNLQALLPENFSAKAMYKASLSFLDIGEKLNYKSSQNICPMEIKAYLFQR